MKTELFRVLQYTRSDGDITFEIQVKRQRNPNDGRTMHYETLYTGVCANEVGCYCQDIIKAEHPTLTE